MNDPELWKKNKPHDRFMRELLEEFKNKSNWRTDGRDSLMDIGCAAMCRRRCDN